MALDVAASPLRCASEPCKEIHELGAGLADAAPSDLLLGLFAPPCMHQDRIFVPVTATSSSKPPFQVLALRGEKL